MGKTEKTTSSQTTEETKASGAEVKEEASKEAKPKAEKKKPEKEKKEPEKTAEQKLKEDLAASNDKYLRLVAEYDNFRKRSAKERLEIYSDATAKTLEGILPVYDNFERALQSKSADENFKKGVEMIFNQFTDALKKAGIEVIDPMGQEFDPNIAQAINQVEDENFGENTVCQVFQKGYKMGDKVVRYAMVVVANP